MGVPTEELAKIFGIVAVNFGEIVCKLALHSISALRTEPKQRNTTSLLLPNPATRFMAQLSRRLSITFWFVLEL